MTTCNRVEVYLATRDPRGTERAVRSWLDGYAPEDISGHVRFKTNEDSARHLFRVAAGVESMVVGEDEILGQVKDAYENGRERGTIGPTLDAAFAKAIQVGKRARTETDINEGATSIGSAAVDLAEDLLGSLEGRTVMVVGAGETATLVAKALSRHELDAIFVANRTRSRAEELASALDGIAVDYDQIADYIPRSDVLISATAAPHAILSRDDLAGMRADDDRLLVVDIAQPRDIDDAAGDLPGLELHNLDSLKSITQEGLEKRREEIARVQEIVEEALHSLELSFAHRDVEDLIGDLYREGLRVREEELGRAFERADFDADQRRVVEDLTEAIVNRLLARPTESLKAASERDDDSTIRAGEEILGLEDEQD